MKILILTLADEPYWPIARISNPNKAAYAAKHGYDFRTYSHRLAEDLPASWSKLHILFDNFTGTGYYDWFFWTDADSLIMNSELKLEDLIGDTEATIIAAYDENGLNTGQFLIKNNFAGYDLIWRADGHREYVNHVWWDQPAIEAAILERGGDSVIMTVDPGLLNRTVPSGPQHNTFSKMIDQTNKVFEVNDFILHWSGCGGERAPLRLEMMKAFLEVAQ